MEAETMKKKGHGPNVTFWKEWKKMTQEQVSELTGYSQGALSKFEKREVLEPEVLEKLANAFDLPVQALTEMGSDNPVNIISSTFHDNAIASMMHCQPTFNPLDKVVELYERMLKAEQEKVALLQEVLRDQEKK